jgi:hypothetical protein
MVKTMEQTACAVPCMPETEMASFRSVYRNERMMCYLNRSNKIHPKAKAMVE